MHQYRPRDQGTVQVQRQAAGVVRSRTVALRLVGDAGAEPIHLTSHFGVAQGQAPVDGQLVLGE